MQENGITETHHQLVQTIFSEAYLAPLPEFKARCFELISEVVKIDSGTWITRCERHIPFYENDSFTYQLPKGFIEDYHHLSTVSSQVHQVFGVVLANLGKTMDILDVVPEEEWFGSDMYRLYCDKFDLHHSLMTVTANPVNQSLNIITFARHDPTLRFSAKDKQIKEFLVPNLAEAMRVNILNSFKQGQLDVSAHRGVFDRYGNLLEAEDGFIQAASQHVLQGSKLMLDVTEDQGSYPLENHQLHYQNHDGLVYVELQGEPLLNQLTDRKLEICQLLLAGQTNKEMARQLSLSPETINNHLKEIYDLLKVRSRHQAVSYLVRQGLT